MAFSGGGAMAAAAEGDRNGQQDLGGSDPQNDPVVVPKPSKPIVVRVKRQREVASIEALWLEVHDRPPKRRSGLESLSLAESEADAGEERGTKHLFSLLETVTSTALKDAVLLESLEELKVEKRNRRKEQRKPNIRPLSPTGRRKAQHDALAKAARFQQVWHSRRGVAQGEEGEDAAAELFRLYDVVRVDVEAEAAAKAAKREKAKQAAEADSWVCNYLPLLREYLPAAASELDSLNAAAQTKSAVQDVGQAEDGSEADEYVYDVYTMEDDTDEEDHYAAYPTVEVQEEEFFLFDAVDSDHDSEDSNAEDNPKNDYPEEEEEEDLCDRSSNSDDDSEVRWEGSEEEYDTVAYDEEEDMRYASQTYDDAEALRWARRR